MQTQTAYFDVDACFGYLNDRVIPRLPFKSENTEMGAPKRSSTVFQPKYTQAQRDEAVRLKQQGISCAKISKQLGIPAPTIENFIKDYRNERTIGRD